MVESDMYDMCDMVNVSIDNQKQLLEVIYYDKYSNTT